MQLSTKKPGLRISAKQAHVLANIDRVRTLQPKLAVKNPLPRYQLDGWECTPQITGLVVRGLVSAAEDGRLLYVKAPVGVIDGYRDQERVSPTPQPLPQPTLPRLAHATADLRGRFVGADQQLCELLACQPGDLFGLTIMDITYEEDRRENRILLERLIETGEPFSIRKRYFRRDAPPVWVENHVARLVQERNGMRLVASIRPVDGPDGEASR